MPVVATMGGICGRLCWACGSERARKAEIEVLCRPRTDHFSRSLKGSRLYAREVTVNDARGQGSPINHGAMEAEVEGDEIESARAKVLEPARAKMGVFLSESSFFSPGQLGFFS